MRTFVMQVQDGDARALEKLQHEWEGVHGRLSRGAFLRKLVTLGMADVQRELAAAEAARSVLGTVDDEVEGGS